MITDGDRNTDDPASRPLATGTILPFRPRPAATQTSPERSTADDSAVDEPDDFRHRMLVNAVGLACAIALTASGIWLASSLSNLRNTQDCVLSGRRNCAPITAVERIPTPAGQH